MTDRYHTLTVTLEREIRDDDAEALIKAIMQMRGVLDVQGEVAEFEFYAAREQAKRDLREELLEVLLPDLAKRRRDSR